jgi:hypothetical protein
LIGTVFHLNFWKDRLLFGKNIFDLARRFSGHIHRADKGIWVRKKVAVNKKCQDTVDDDECKKHSVSASFPKTTDFVSHGYIFLGIFPSSMTPKNNGTNDISCQDVGAVFKNIHAKTNVTSGEKTAQCICFRYRDPMDAFNP